MKDKTAAEKIASADEMLNTIHSAAFELRIMRRRTKHEILEAEVRSACECFRKHLTKELLSEIDTDVFELNTREDKLLLGNPDFTSVLDILEAETDDIPKHIYEKAVNIQKTIEEQADVSLALSLGTKSAAELCEVLFRFTELSAIKAEINALADVYLDMSDKIHSISDNSRNAVKRFSHKVNNDAQFCMEVTELSCGRQHDEYTRLKDRFNAIILRPAEECRYIMHNTPKQYIVELEKMGLCFPTKEGTADVAKMPDRREFEKLEADVLRAIEQLDSVIVYSESETNDAIKTMAEAFLDGQIRDKITDLDLRVLSYMKSGSNTDLLRKSKLNTVSDVIDLDKSVLTNLLGYNIHYVVNTLKSMSELKKRAENLVSVGALNTCTPEQAKNLLRAIFIHEKMADINDRKKALRELLPDNIRSAASVSLPTHDLTWEFLPERKKSMIQEAYCSMKTAESRGAIREIATLKTIYDSLINPSQNDLYNSFAHKKDYCFSVLKKLGYHVDSKETAESANMPDIKAYRASLRCLNNFVEKALPIIDAEARQKSKLKTGVEEIKAEWVTLTAKRTGLAIIKEYISGARVDLLRGHYGSLLEVYNSNALRLQNIHGIGPIGASKIMIGARLAYSNIEKNYKLRVESIQNTATGNEFMVSLYLLYNSNVLRAKLKEKLDVIKQILAESVSVDVPSNCVYWYFMTEKSRVATIDFCNRLSEKTVQISEDEQLIQAYNAIQRTDRAEAIQNVKDYSGIYNGFLNAALGQFGV